MRGKAGARAAAPRAATKTSIRPAWRTVLRDRFGEEWSSVRRPRPGLVLKVRMGDRLDGGVVPRVSRGAQIFREAGGWAYIAGSRQGLKALHAALERVLRSRTIEIFEGPGYTVIYDRRS